MSYNISSIRILKSENFGITEEAFADVNRVQAPESWPRTVAELQQRLATGRFPWCGEASGYWSDVLTLFVLPKFTGSAELLLIWEGGDDLQGARITNGVVTMHKVETTLTEAL